MKAPALLLVLLMWALATLHSIVPARPQVAPREGPRCVDTAQSP